MRCPTGSDPLPVHSRSPQPPAHSTVRLWWLSLQDGEQNRARAVLVGNSSPQATHVTARIPRGSPERRQRR